METKYLKQYLEMALDLEAKKLITEEVLERVEQKKIDIRYLQLEKQVVDNRPYENSVNERTFSTIGAIVGFFTLGPSASLILAIVGICIGWFAGKYIAKKINEKSILKEMEERGIANERRNCSIVERNQKKINEANEHNRIVGSALEKLRETRDSIDKTLVNIYSRDIIHPKYRDRVALLYIYNYLDTGICTGLEGVDGAYRQYETDVRLDRISSQLGVIIGKLDTIVMKMDRMFSQFAEFSNEMKISMGGIQHTIDGLSTQIETQTKQLNEIGVTSAITAYTTQVIERNQYYERNWQNGRGLYDHVNMPKG